MHYFFSRQKFFSFVVCFFGIKRINCVPELYRFSDFSLSSSSSDADFDTAACNNSSLSIGHPLSPGCYETYYA